MSTASARILDGLTPRQAEVAKKHGQASRLRRTGVLAGTGTGKTRTLTAATAHRIAHDGMPPLRILAA